MIIDFHTHIFPEKIAAQTVAALAKVSSSEPHSNGCEDGLISALREARADIAVNLPVLTKPTQFDSIKGFAESLNKKAYGAERIISFAGAHPLMEEPEEKLASLRESGFLGIKIHPDYQSTFFDDDSYFRILKAAKELDLITVTHAGLDGAYVGQPIKCTPERVLRMLDRLGGYDRLVLAHMGGNALFEEVYSSLAGENIYFDTSYVLHSISEDMFLKILSRHGEDKILFATDSPWQRISREVEIIKSFALGDSTEEKIFYKNAAFLLGI